MKIVGRPWLHKVIAVACLAGGPAVAVANADLEKLIADPKNWAMQAGDMYNQRYSKLAQINEKNVGKMQVAWMFSTGVLRGHEGSPLVMNGTMYLHTPFPNKVFAIDLDTQKIKWRYEPKQDVAVIPQMCCDTVYRGLAYAENKIFLQQADSTLVALDANTGKVIWSVKNGDPKIGAVNTNAPHVFKDKVITGISGGEWGVRGFLAAYDINTGKQVWKAYSVGPDAEMLMDPDKTMTWTDGAMKPVGKDSSLKTWKGDQWKTRRRHDVGLVQLRQGAEPAVLRHGQSVDVESGAAARRQQVVDDDLRARRRYRHGEVGVPDDAVRRVGFRRHQRNDPRRHQRQGQADEGARPLRPQRLRLHARSHDGRAAGRREVRPDGELGDARRHEDRRPQVVAKYSTAKNGPDVNTKGICPAALGSKDEQPAAFNPKNSRFYVPTNHVCMDYEPFKVDYMAGQPYVGATLSMFPAPGGTNMGNFVAWDAGTGKIVQSKAEKFSVWSGALTTAGDIACYGTLEGYLKCVDANDINKELFKFKTPSGHHRQRVHLRAQGQAVHGRVLGHRRLGRHRHGGGPREGPGRPRRRGRLQGTARLHRARRLADGIRAAVVGSCSTIAGAPLRRAGDVRLCTGKRVATFPRARRSKPR